MQDKTSAGTQPQFLISPKIDSRMEIDPQEPKNQRGSNNKLEKQQLQQTQFSIPLPDGIISPDQSAGIESQVAQNFRRNMQKRFGATATGGFMSVPKNTLSSFRNSSNSRHFDLNRT